ncbi:hypothetical protein GCM10009624_30640 [Gordonia sinesedis]
MRVDTLVGLRSTVGCVAVAHRGASRHQRPGVSGPHPSYLADDHDGLADHHHGASPTTTTGLADDHDGSEREQWAGS